MNFSIEEAEIAPGTLGLLYDETPKLTHADVRPFVWAILLYRGAVKQHELIGAITPLCAHGELYSGWSDDLDPDGRQNAPGVAYGRGSWGDDSEGILRYSMQADLWVLTAGANQRHLPTIIKATAGVDGSLPKHLIAELD